MKYLVHFFMVLLISTSLMTGVLGCKDRDSQVRSYRTDKGPEVQSPEVAPVSELPRSSGAPYAWEAPEGWIASAGGTMRLITFRMPAGERQGECSVIELGGPAGGIVANVNRWRGQIGLPAVEAGAIESSALEGQGGLGKFQYFKLINPEKPEQAFLAGILPAGNTTLFIKLDAPSSQIDVLESPFVTFCESVKRSP